MILQEKKCGFSLVDMDCEENYPKTRLECMALSQQLPQRVISFSDVIQGRDANVRITDDGLLYAVDLVMVMTGKDMKSANQVKTL